VLVIISRQPAANIIDTVDRVLAELPQLQASIPATIDLSVVMDRTTTIRASLHDVEVTLVISVILVTLVVFLFLRNVRATLIPTVAVPVSLMGGVVGRLFREFAITLSAAVGISLVVSLTTTPMMCALLLGSERETRHGRLYRVTERGFDWILLQYDRTLSWVLRHPVPVLLVA